MAATSRARPRSEDRGAVTVEAAIALCGLIAVLVLVLAGLSAVLDQIRCTDAAGQAARLVARGEAGPARQLAARLAPSGADIRIATAAATTGTATTGSATTGAAAIRADTATVTVSVVPAGGLIPGLRLTASALAVLEPAPSANP